MNGCKEKVFRLRDHIDENYIFIMKIHTEYYMMCLRMMMVV